MAAAIRSETPPAVLRAVVTEPPLAHSVTVPAVPITQPALTIVRPLQEHPVQLPAMGEGGSPRRSAAAALLKLPAPRGAYEPSRPASTDSFEDAAEPLDADGNAPSAKARHNATERRRVQKLKDAYMELDAVLRSRPDLIHVPAYEIAGRKRGRDDEGGPGGKGPSHLQVLSSSAQAVQNLFALVDEMKRNGAASTENVSCRNHGGD